MPSLESILAQWTKWQDVWPINQAPELIKTFTQGLNHQTVLTANPEKPAQQAVLKIFSQANPFAIQSQQWAAQHKLAPNIIYADSKHQYILMDFFLQESLAQAKLQTLAVQLKKLHTLPAPDFIQQRPALDLLGYLDKYLSRLPKQHRFFAQIEQVHQKALKHLSAVAKLNTVCVCHNDLVKHNLLFNNRHCYLLDWEYTQRNFPEFDLASVLLYLQLDNQQSQHFLSSYYQNTYHNSYQHQQWQLDSIQALKPLVLWLDILWQLQKKGIDHWLQLEKLCGSF